MEFAPEKNELLHFNSARAACELFLRLGTVIIQPITDARFLRVWLNNKLFWKNHLAKIKGKMVIQMLVFSKLAASAWGTSVFSARQMYAMVIRSVLAYAAPNWHNMGDRLKKFSKTLTPVQNKCLRIVSGAYKIIPTRYLESEIAVPSLDLYFNKWVADFKNRIKLSGTMRLLRAAGARATELAIGHRRSRRRRRRGIAEPIIRD
jgi:hypothetical protein